MQFVKFQLISDCLLSSDRHCPRCFEEMRIDQFTFVLFVCIYQCECKSWGADSSIGQKSSCEEYTPHTAKCILGGVYDDILFQIPLSCKDIYSRFWLVKTTVWPNTRKKQTNQKRLYIFMWLSGIWNKKSCTNTQTVKTTVWHKQTGCSAG